MNNFELYKQRQAGIDQSLVDNLVKKNLLTQEQANSFMQASPGSTTPTPDTGNLLGRIATANPAQPEGTPTLSPSQLQHDILQNTQEAVNINTQHANRINQTARGPQGPTFTQSLAYLAQSQDVPGSHRANYRQLYEKVMEQPERFANLNALHEMMSPRKRERWMRRMGLGASPESAAGTGHINMTWGWGQELWDIPNRIKHADPVGVFTKDFQDKSERWGGPLGGGVAMLGHIVWGTIAGTFEGLYNIGRGSADLEELVHVGSMAAILATAGLSTAGAITRTVGGASKVGKGLGYATKIRSMQLRLAGLPKELAEEVAKTGKYKMKSLKKHFPDLAKKVEESGGKLQVGLPELIGAGQTNSKLGKVTKYSQWSEFPIVPDELLYEIAGDLGIGSITRFGGTAYGALLEHWDNKATQQKVDAVAEVLNEKTKDFDPDAAQVFQASIENARQSGDPDEIDKVVEEINRYIDNLNGKDPDEETKSDDNFEENVNNSFSDTATDEDEDTTTDDQDQQDTQTGDEQDTGQPTEQQPTEEGQPTEQGTEGQPTEQPLEEGTERTADEQHAFDQSEEELDALKNLTTGDRTAGQLGIQTDGDTSAGEVVIEKGQPFTGRMGESKMSFAWLAAIKKKGKNVAKAVVNILNLKAELINLQAENVGEGETENADARFAQLTEEIRKATDSFLETLAPGAAKPKTETEGGTTSEAEDNFLEPGRRKDVYMENLDMFLQAAMKSYSQEGDRDSLIELQEMYDTIMQIMDEVTTEVTQGSATPTDTQVTDTGPQPVEEEPSFTYNPKYSVADIDKPWVDALASLRQEGNITFHRAVTAAEFLEIFKDADFMPDDSTPQTVGRKLSAIASAEGHPINVVNQENNQPNLYVIADDYLISAEPSTPIEPTPTETDTSDVDDQLTEIFGHKPDEDPGTDPNVTQSNVGRQAKIDDLKDIAREHIESGEEGRNKIQSKIDEYEALENPTEAQLLVIEAFKQALEEFSTPTLPNVGFEDDPESDPSAPEIQHLPLHDENATQILYKSDFSSPKNQFLSNFSAFGFSSGGMFWKTVEHFFQFMKFPKGAATRRKILRTGSPASAWFLGSKSDEKIDESWIMPTTDKNGNMQEPRRDRVMREALELKFQSKVVLDLNGVKGTLADHLLKTGDKQLLHLEHTPGHVPYWGITPKGDGTYVGRNRHGEMLMELRDKIRQDPSKYPSVDSNKELLTNPVYALTHSQFPANTDFSSSNLPTIIYARGNKDILGGKIITVAGSNRVTSPRDENNKFKNTTEEWNDEDWADKAMRLGLIENPTQLNDKVKEAVKASFADVGTGLEYGNIEKFAFLVGQEAAKAGYTIASGGASGADSAAMNGARGKAIIPYNLEDQSLGEDPDANGNVIAVNVSNIETIDPDTGEESQLYPSYPSYSSKMGGVQWSDDVLNLSLVSPDAPQGYMNNRHPDHPDVSPATFQGGTFERNGLVAGLGKVMFIPGAFAKKGTVDAARKALLAGAKIVILDPEIFDGPMEGSREILGYQGVFKIPKDKLVDVAEDGTITPKETFGRTVVRYIQAVERLQEFGQETGIGSIPDDLIKKTENYTDTDFENEIKRVQEVGRQAAEKDEIGTVITAKQELISLARLKALRDPAPQRAPVDDYGRHTPLTDQEREITGGLIGLNNYDSFEELLHSLRAHGQTVFVDTRLNPYAKSSKEESETGDRIITPDWYDGVELGRRLGEHGITYVYAPQFAPTEALEKIQNRIDQTVVTTGGSMDRSHIGTGFISQYINKIRRNPAADLGIFIKEQIVNHLGYDNLSGSAIFFATEERRSESSHRSLIGNMMTHNLGITVQNVEGSNVETISPNILYARTKSPTPSILESGDPFGHNGKIETVIPPAESHLAPGQDSPMRLVDYGDDYASYRNPSYPGWIITVKSNGNTKESGVKLELTNPGALHSENIDIGSFEVSSEMDNVLNTAYASIDNMADFAEEALANHLPSSADFHSDAEYDNVEAHPDSPYDAATSRHLIVRDVKLDKYEIEIGNSPTVSTKGMRKVFGTQYGVREVGDDFEFEGEGRFLRVDDETEHTVKHYILKRPGVLNGQVEIRLSFSGKYLQIITKPNSGLKLPDKFPRIIKIKEDWEGARNRDLLILNNLIKQHGLGEQFKNTQNFQNARNLILWDFLTNDARSWGNTSENPTIDGLAGSHRDLPLYIQETVFAGMDAEGAIKQWDLVKSFIRRGHTVKDGEAYFRPDEAEAAERFARRLPKAPTIPSQVLHYFRAIENAQRDNTPGLKRTGVVEFEEKVRDETPVLRLDEAGGVIGDPEDRAERDFDEPDQVVSPDIPELEEPEGAEPKTEDVVDEPEDEDVTDVVTPVEDDYTRKMELIELDDPDTMEKLWDDGTLLLPERTDEETGEKRKRSSHQLMSIVRNDLFVNILKERGMDSSLRTRANKARVRLSYFLSGPESAPVVMDSADIEDMMLYGGGIEIHDDEGWNADSNVAEIDGENVENYTPEEIRGLVSYKQEELRKRLSQNKKLTPEGIDSRVSSHKFKVKLKGYDFRRWSRRPEELNFALNTLQEASNILRDAGYVPYLAAHTITVNRRMLSKTFFGNRMAGERFNTTQVPNLVRNIHDGPSKAYSEGLVQVYITTTGVVVPVATSNLYIVDYEKSNIYKRPPEQLEMSVVRERSEDEDGRERDYFGSFNGKGYDFRVVGDGPNFLVGEIIGTGQIVSFNKQTGVVTFPPTGLNVGQPSLIPADPSNNQVVVENWNQRGLTVSNIEGRPPANAELAIVMATRHGFMANTDLPIKLESMDLSGLGSWTYAMQAGTRMELDENDNGKHVSGNYTFRVDTYFDRAKEQYRYRVSAFRDGEAANIFGQGISFINTDMEKDGHVRSPYKIIQAAITVRQPEATERYGWEVEEDPDIEAQFARERLVLRPGTRDADPDVIQVQDFAVERQSDIIRTVEEFNAYLAHVGMERPVDWEFASQELINMMAEQIKAIQEARGEPKSDIDNATARSAVRVLEKATLYLNDKNQVDALLRQTLEAHGVDLQDNDVVINNSVFSLMHHNFKKRGAWSPTGTSDLVLTEQVGIQRTYEFEGLPEYYVIAVEGSTGAIVYYSPNAKNKEIRKSLDNMPGLGISVEHADFEVDSTGDPYVGYINIGDNGLPWQVIEREMLGVIFSHQKEIDNRVKYYTGTYPNETQNRQEVRPTELEGKKVVQGDKATHVVWNLNTNHKIIFDYETGKAVGYRNGVRQDVTERSVKYIESPVFQFREAELIADMLVQLDRIHESLPYSARGKIIEIGTEYISGYNKDADIEGREGDYKSSITRPEIRRFRHPDMPNVVAELRIIPDELKNNVAEAMSYMRLVFLDTETGEYFQYDETGNRIPDPYAIHPQPKSGFESTRKMFNIPPYENPTDLQTFNYDTKEYRDAYYEQINEYKKRGIVIQTEVTRSIDGKYYYLQDHGISNETVRWNVEQAWIAASAGLYPGFKSWQAGYVQSLINDIEYNPGFDELGPGIAAFSNRRTLTEPLTRAGSAKRYLQSSSQDAQHEEQITSFRNSITEAEERFINKVNIANYQRTFENLVELPLIGLKPNAVALGVPGIDASVELIEFSSGTPRAPVGMGAANVAPVQSDIAPFVQHAQADGFVYTTPNHLLDVVVYRDEDTSTYTATVTHAGGLGTITISKIPEEGISKGIVNKGDMSPLARDLYGLGIQDMSVDVNDYDKSAALGVLYYFKYAEAANDINQDADAVSIPNYPDIEVEVEDFWMETAANGEPIQTLDVGKIPAYGYEMERIERHLSYRERLRKDLTAREQNQRLQRMRELEAEMRLIEKTQDKDISDFFRTRAVAEELFDIWNMDIGITRDEFTRDEPDFDSMLQRVNDILAGTQGVDIETNRRGQLEAFKDLIATMSKLHRNISHNLPKALFLNSLETEALQADSFEQPIHKVPTSSLIRVIGDIHRIRNLQETISNLISNFDEYNQLVRGAGQATADDGLLSIDAILSLEALTTQTVSQPTPQSQEIRQHIQYLKERIDAIKQTSEDFYMLEPLATRLLDQADPKVPKTSAEITARIVDLNQALGFVNEAEKISVLTIDTDTFRQVETSAKVTGDDVGDNAKIFEGIPEGYTEHTPIQEDSTEGFSYRHASYLVDDNPFIQINVLQKQLSQSTDDIIIDVEPRFPMARQDESLMKIRVELSIDRKNSDGQVLEFNDSHFEAIVSHFLIANKEVLNKWVNISEYHSYGTGMFSNVNNPNKDSRITFLTPDINIEVRPHSNGEGYLAGFFNSQGRSLYGILKDPEVLMEKVIQDANKRASGNLHDNELIENIDALDLPEAPWEGAFMIYVRADNPYDATKKALLQRLNLERNIVRDEVRSDEGFVIEPAVLDRRRLFRRPRTKRTQVSKAVINPKYNVADEHKPILSALVAAGVPIAARDIIRRSGAKLPDGITSQQIAGILGSLANQNNPPVRIVKHQDGRTNLYATQIDYVTGIKKSISQEGDSVFDNYRTLNQAISVQSKMLREKGFVDDEEMAEDRQSLRNKFASADWTTEKELIKSKLFEELDADELMEIEKLTTSIAGEQLDPAYPKNAILIQNIWNYATSELKRIEESNAPTAQKVIERTRMWRGLHRKFMEEFIRTHEGYSVMGHPGTGRLARLAVNSVLYRQLGNVLNNPEILTKNNLVDNNWYHRILQIGSEIGNDPGNLPPHLGYLAVKVAGLEGDENVRIENAGDGWLYTLLDKVGVNIEAVESDPARQNMFMNVFGEESGNSLEPTPTNNAVDVVITENPERVSVKQLMNGVVQGGRLIITGNTAYHHALSSAMKAVANDKSYEGYVESLKHRGDLNTSDITTRANMFNDIKELGVQIQGIGEFTTEAYNSDYLNQDGVLLVIQNVPKYKGPHSISRVNFDKGLKGYDFLGAYDKLSKRWQPPNKALTDTKKANTDAKQQKEQAKAESRKVVKNSIVSQLKITPKKYNIKQRIMNLGHKVQKAGIISAGTLIPQGTSVESLAELGLIAEIARDPRMSTSQVLMVKDGVVIGSSLSGVRTAGDARIDTEYINSKLATNNGYNSIVVANRPSGDVSITEEDKQQVRDLVERNNELQYMFIKDGGRYSAIIPARNENGEVMVGDDGNVIVQVVENQPIKGEFQGRASQQRSYPSWINKEDPDVVENFEKRRDEAVSIMTSNMQDLTSSHLSLIENLVESNDDWGVVALVNADNTIADMVEIPDIMSLDENAVATAITTIRETLGGLNAYLIVRSTEHINGGNQFYSNTGVGTYLANSPDINGSYLLQGQRHYPSNYIQRYDPEIPANAPVELALSVLPKNHLVDNLPMDLAKLVDSKVTGDIWTHAQNIYNNAISPMMQGGPLSLNDLRSLRHLLNLGIANRMAEGTQPSFVSSSTNAQGTFENLMREYRRFNQRGEQQDSSMPLNGPGQSVHPAFAFIMHYISTADPDEVVLIPNANTGNLISYGNGAPGLMRPTESDPVKRELIHRVFGLPHELIGHQSSQDLYNEWQSDEDTSQNPADVILLDSLSTNDFWSEVNQALHTLKDGGRLVAHVNIDGMTDEQKQAFKQSRELNVAEMQKYYDVKGLIGHAGRLVMVVDKVSPTETELTMRYTTDPKEFAKMAHSLRLARRGEPDIEPVTPEELVQDTPPPADTEPDDETEESIDGASTTKPVEEETKPDEEAAYREDANDTDDEAIRMFNGWSHREFLEETEKALKNVGYTADLKTISGINQVQESVRSSQSVGLPEGQWLNGFIPAYGWRFFMNRLNSVLTESSLYNMAEFQIHESVDYNQDNIDNILDTEDVNVSAVVATSHALNTGSPLLLEGQVVKNAQEVAVLYQPFRNAGYEKSLFVGVDENGVVVKTKGLTIGSSDQTQKLNYVDVKLILDTYPEIKNFWFVHHHPEFTTDPSPSDVEASRTMAEIFEDMYLGEVITDTNEFTSITMEDVDGTMQEMIHLRKKMLPDDEYRDTRTPIRKHPIINTEIEISQAYSQDINEILNSSVITTSDQVAKHAKDYMSRLNSEEDVATLVYLGYRSEGVDTEVPTLQILGLEHYSGLHNYDIEGVKNHISLRAGHHTAVKVFAIINNPTDPSLYKNFWKELNTETDGTHIVSDVYVDTNDPNFKDINKNFSRVRGQVQTGRADGDTKRVVLDETGGIIDIQKQDKFRTYILYKYLLQDKKIDDNVFEKAREYFGEHMGAPVSNEFVTGLIDEAFWSYVNIAGLWEPFDGSGVDPEPVILMINDAYENIWWNTSRKTPGPRVTDRHKMTVNQAVRHGPPPVVDWLTLFSMDLQEGEVFDYPFKLYNRGMNPIQHESNKLGVRRRDSDAFDDKQFGYMTGKSTVKIARIGDKSVVDDIKHSNNPLDEVRRSLRELAPGGRLYAQIDPNFEPDRELNVDAPRLAAVIQAYQNYLSDGDQQSLLNRFDHLKLTQSEVDFYTAFLGDLFENYIFRAAIRISPYSMQLVIDKPIEGASPTEDNKNGVGFMFEHDHRNIHTFTELYLKLRKSRVPMADKWLQKGPDTEKQRKEDDKKGISISHRSNLEQALIRDEAQEERRMEMVDLLGYDSTNQPVRETTTNSLGYTQPIYVNSNTASLLDDAEDTTVESNVIRDEGPAGYTQIQVYGLNNRISPDDLIEIFSQYGEVNQRVDIPSRSDGTRDNFGWVYMKNEKEAQRAAAELNRSMIGNQQVRVRIPDRVSAIPGTEQDGPTDLESISPAWQYFFENPYIPRRIKDWWQRVYDVHIETVEEGIDEEGYNLAKATYHRLGKNSRMKMREKVKQWFLKPWETRLGQQLSRPITQIARWGTAGKIVGSLLTRTDYEARRRRGRIKDILRGVRNELYDTTEISDYLKKGDKLRVVHRKGWGYSWFNRIPSLDTFIDSEDGVQKVYEVKTGKVLTVMEDSVETVGGEEVTYTDWVTYLDVKHDHLLDAWVTAHFNKRNFSVGTSGVESAEQRVIKTKIGAGVNKIIAELDAIDQEIIDANVSIMKSGLLTDLNSASDIVEGRDIINKDRLIEYAKRFGINLPNRIEIKKMPQIGKTNYGNMREWQILSGTKEIFRIRQFDAMNSVIRQGRRNDEDLRGRDAERHAKSVSLYSEFKGKTLIYNADPRDPIFSKQEETPVQLFAGRPHDLPQMVNWAGMDPAQDAEHKRKERFDEYVDRFYEINKDIHSNDPGWRYQGHEWTREVAENILRKKYKAFRENEFDPLEGDSELTFPSTAYESLVVLELYAERATQRASEIFNYGQNLDILADTLDELKNPEHMDFLDREEKAILKLRAAFGHNDFKRMGGSFDLESPFLVPYTVADGTPQTTDPRFDHMTPDDWEALIDLEIVTRVNDAYYAWANPSIEKDVVTDQETGESSKIASVREGDKVIEFTLAANAGGLINSALLPIKDPRLKATEIGIQRYEMAKQIVADQHTWDPMLIEAHSQERYIRKHQVEDTKDLERLKDDLRENNSAYYDIIYKEQEKLRNPLYLSIWRLQNLAVGLFMRLSSATQIGTLHNAAHRTGTPELIKSIRDIIMSETDRDRLNYLGAMELEMTQAIAFRPEAISQDKVSFTQRIVGGNDRWRFRGHGTISNFMRNFIRRGNLSPFAFLERYMIRGPAAITGKYLTKDVLNTVLLRKDPNVEIQKSERYRLEELDLSIPELLDDVLNIPPPEGGWTKELIDELTEVYDENPKEFAKKYPNNPEYIAIVKLTNRVMQVMPDYAHYQGSNMHTPELVRKHPFLQVMLLFQRIMLAQMGVMARMLKYGYNQIAMTSQEAAEKAGITDLEGLQKAGYITRETLRKIPHLAGSIAMILGSGYAATILAELARFRTPDEDDLAISTAVLNSAVFGVLTGYIEGYGHHRGITRQFGGPILGLVEEMAKDFPTGAAETAAFYLTRPTVVDFRPALGLFSRETPHDVDPGFQEGAGIRQSTVEAPIRAVAP